MVDSFVSLAVLLAILLAGTYSGYALWDNNQVYRAAAFFALAGFPIQYTL